MRTVLIIAILIISTAPLYAQGAQPDAAKLKADARNVVGIIGGDKAKTQAYCQIAIVGEQMNQAIQVKDKKKFDELAQKLPELEKSLDPEYLWVGRVSREGEPPAKRWPGDRIDFRYARCVVSPLSSYRTSIADEMREGHPVACWAANCSPGRCAEECGSPMMAIARRASRAEFCQMLPPVLPRRPFGKWLFWLTC